MKRLIQETGGVMIYKNEEMKQVISVKSVMGDVTILSVSSSQSFVTFHHNFWYECLLLKNNQR